MNAMQTPIRSPPRILAATVPSGIVGKIGLRSIPKTQRIHAPAAAPPPTATTDQPEISVPKVRLRCHLILPRLRRSRDRVRQQRGGDPEADRDESRDEAKAEP